VVTLETQLEKRVHLLLVGEHVGLQEPELEDLEGVDGKFCYLKFVIRPDLPSSPPTLLKGLIAEVLQCTSCIG
jgi:hypothetical protein